MRYVGKLYRPWMEADSLLIQCTIGCSHNSCTFCDMYREQPFRIRPLDDILEDIRTARSHFRHMPSLFLTDGNVLSLKMEMLLPILETIRQEFPECRRVTLYGSFRDMQRKTVAELQQLKAAGLSAIYVGLESGDPETLARIGKHYTHAQALEGMHHAKAAGIPVVASLILGIAGRERSREHATATAALLNELAPEEIAILTLAVQPGTVLAEQVERGEFVQATPKQLLEEERALLEGLGMFDTYYWGDHNSNLTPKRGRLPAAREAFLEKVRQDLQCHPALGREVHAVRPW